MEIRQSLRLIAFLLIGYFLGFMLFSCTTLQPARKVVYTEGFARNQVSLLQGPTGSCSGVRVTTTRGTYILTAAHCYDLNVQEAILSTDQQGSSYVAGVIAVSQNSDLMLLTAPPGPSGLRLAAKAPQLTESVHALGHAFGLPSIKTAGEIVCYSTLQTAICTQMSEPTAVGLATITTVMAIPGMSGGPLLNEKNQIIGIVHVYSGEHPMYSAHVSLFDIQEFLKDY